MVGTPINNLGSLLTSEKIFKNVSSSFFPPQKFKVSCVLCYKWIHYNTVVLTLFFQSCEELVSCLSRGDFADFTAQLEGLASIYQLNAEKKVKCKAFSALQSLEADLGTLATLQSFIKEPFNLVHKSPVGILEKRRGGIQNIFM